MPAAFMNNAVGKCSAPYRPDELKISLSGLVLGIVDQFLDALVRLLIVDQQNHGAGRQPCDRNEADA